jgi:3-(3-hydroxy-phenyl)propionate hydroxylase
VLLELLANERNVEVSFGSTLSHIGQDEDAVVVGVTSQQGGRSVRARMLVGADGSRSFVRRALGLPFEGQTYPETTLLVTTTFPFEDHLRGLSNVSYCWKEGGNFSLLKVPGRWRVSIYPREDLAVEDQLADEAIEASLQEIVPRSERYEVLEKRAYRVHQRIVPTYRIGRVALAGDAAHLNSPAGGMGLNGGIHDAFALADAVGDILQRGAGLERLDLYDRQRRPVAEEQILAQADRNRARMREKDPARRGVMLAELQAITQDPVTLKAYLMRSSMIEGLRQARMAA